MLCTCIDYVSVGVVQYVVVVCIGTILKYMSQFAAVCRTTHSVQITEGYKLTGITGGECQE